MSTSSNKPGIIEFIKQELREEAKDYSTENYQRQLRLEGYRFIPSVDDWYGSFPDGTVGVALFGPDDITSKHWVILFTGTDDHAMSRQFDLGDEETAYRLFNNLPSIIMVDDLIAMGFGYE